MAAASATAIATITTNCPSFCWADGSGTLKPGRHIRYPHDTPLNNLWLAMLDRLDVKTEKLGDGTGSLKHLDG